MRVFLVDGSRRNLADIILENIVTGKTCYVSSYGFGVKQVDRLIRAFEHVLLVADTSHSQLNSDAYKAIVGRSRNLSGFTFKQIKNHSKLALIDDEIIIFTSANLSANRRVESYLIGSFGEVGGIEELKKMFLAPGDSFNICCLEKGSEKSGTGLGSLECGLDLGGFEL